MSSVIEIVAHRGSREGAAEHTLTAYRTAIRDGADALECDVRLTADGTLVCLHDRRVDFVSDGRGVVSAMELAELAAFTFGSRRPWRALDRHRAPGPQSVPVGHDVVPLVTAMTARLCRLPLAMWSLLAFLVRALTAVPV